MGSLNLVLEEPGNLTVTLDHMTVTCLYGELLVSGMVQGLCIRQFCFVFVNLTQVKVM